MTKKDICHFLNCICAESHTALQQRADEVKLLISSGYAPKDVYRVVDSYAFDKPDINKEAVHRIDTLCISCMRGASDCSRKQLANK